MGWFADRSTGLRARAHLRKIATAAETLCRNSPAAFALSLLTAASIAFEIAAELTEGQEEMLAILTGPPPTSDKAALSSIYRSYETIVFRTQEQRIRACVAMPDLERHEFWKNTEVTQVAHSLILANIAGALIGSGNESARRIQGALSSLDRDAMLAAVNSVRLHARSVDAEAVNAYLEGAIRLRRYCCA